MNWSGEAGHLKMREKKTRRIQVFVLFSGICLFFFISRPLFFHSALRYWSAGGRREACPQILHKSDCSLTCAGVETQKKNGAKWIAVKAEQKFHINLHSSSQDGA